VSTSAGGQQDPDEPVGENASGHVESVIGAFNFEQLSLVSEAGAERSQESLTAAVQPRAEA
jgi:hypothetical protein